MTTKLAYKAEKKSELKVALLVVKSFIRQLVTEFCNADGETYKNVKGQYTKILDTSLPVGDQPLKVVATDRPDPGLVYRGKVSFKKKFFKLQDMRKCTNDYLLGGIEAV
ncbi:hypothetical protein L1887_02312 [Cichorium endivia]|nr:hypothetical protein L1887_02312 [Cichorium endivia]